MRLTPWIDAVRQRLACHRVTRRRARRSTRQVERLEDRTLLDATSLWIPSAGLLSVTATSGEAITISSDTQTNVQVAINGEIDQSLPAIPVNTVQQILVQGGDGPNVIDLSQVRSALFNFSSGGIGVQIDINGNDGNDTITGSLDLDDTIAGGDGADILNGGSGNNSLDGGDGNDSIKGGSGSDNIVGEDGQDTLLGQDGNDTITGGNGHDSILGNAGIDSLQGGHGRDTLFGGTEDDTLDGGDGRDLLNGDAGDDKLMGGIDRDTLLGGADDDTLLGQAGPDSLVGGSGDDSLVGGTDSDTLLGETGDDRLNGQRDNDTLDGGTGDDALLAGHGSDLLLGGDDNDTLRGHGGNDTLLDSSGDDYMDGSTGRDLVDSRAAYLVIDDVQLAVEGDAGDTSLLTFTVSLIGGSSSTFTVDFATSDGTATAGSDYVSSNGQLSFAPGDTSQAIDVTVKGDTTSEATESFLVTLSNSGNVVLFDAIGQGTIIDDDQVAGIDFPGHIQSGTPPDPTAAAGPNNLIAMVNSDIGIWNKDGTLVGTGLLNDFFEEVDRDFGPFDPWATYDQYSDRYIVVAEELEFGSVNQDGSGGQTGGGYGADEAYLLIAISTSDTPDDLDITAGDNDWDVFSIPATHDFGGGSSWIDYPKITADADSIYITGNYFAFGDRSSQGVRVTRLDKTPMLSGTLGNRTDVVAAGGFTLQPALSVGRPAADPQLFVEAGNNSINVWEMDDSNTLTIAASLSAPYAGPNFGVPQQGTTATLDTVAPRMMNAVWRNDSLWATHTVDVGGIATARWYEITTTGSTYSLSQTGDISPGGAVHTFMPGISVDANGNMGITYTQSSSNQFPAMMYAGRQAGDPSGTTRAGSVIKASDTFYAGAGGAGTVNRWGDYAGIAIDPADSETFWAFHQYAPSNLNWGTWWGSFRFASDPPPPPPPGSSGGTVTVTGSDTLLGGNGNDTLLAGLTDDFLDGGMAKDSIDGGEGDDTILGGHGRDTIDGGGGSDSILGGLGNDLITGGDGDDILTWDLSDSADTTSGGNGFDQLVVRGSDVVDNFNVTKSSGGSARMRIDNGTSTLTLGTSVEQVELTAGDGNDTVSISDLRGVPGTLLTIRGEDGDDTLSAAEAPLGNVRLLLDGGDGLDVLTGSQNDDSLYGGLGNDSLVGGDGADLVDADEGDDTLLGGDGNDTLDGGDGNDTLMGNPGNDSMIGGDGNDTLTAGLDHDTLIGGEGDDKLNGQTGNDQIFGQNGADTLIGGSGDDVLDGGLNNDLLLGNDGNDRLRGDDGDDELRGDSGDDLLNGGDGNDTLDGASGADGLNGGDGDDTINAGSSDDTVIGGDGNDLLFGGSGADIVLGEDGNDVVRGQGNSNDTLAGGEGSDQLVGLADEIDEAFVLSSSIRALLEAL